MILIFNGKGFYAFMHTAFLLQKEHFENLRSDLSERSKALTAFKLLNGTSTEGMDYMKHKTLFATFVAS